MTQTILVETITWIWLCFLCSCSASSLWKREVHHAIPRYAVCNDFTPAAFYIRKQSPVRWVIYLESGGGCSSISECNDRYLVNEDGLNTTNELMTSSQLPASVTGRDLLSTNQEENPTFHHFTHVMIPYCSSDLWLGQGNNSRFPGQEFQFHNDSSVNDFIFRGYTIFHSAIEDLMLDGLMNATEVLMVGSSAGGIGVLNHVRSLQSTLPTATVAAVLDSSWFIDFDTNLALRFTYETAVLSQYALLPACQRNTQGYPCCVSVKCMLQEHLFPPHTPLFIISSVYDIYMLSESIKQLSEEEAGLFDYTRTVFRYGGAMNESVENAVSMNRVSLFMPSCTQHVYLATSSLWDPGQLFNRSISHDYSRETAYFQHAIKPGNWRKVSINGITLQAAISSWYNSNYTKNHKLLDNCSAVICNPTCPDQFTFSVEDIGWSSAAKAAVIAIATSICFICAAVKLTMLSYQRWLAGYYSQHERDEEDSKTCLPDCPTEEQMNIACMNLRYSIPPTKRSRSRRLKDRRRSSFTTTRTHIINNVSTYFNPGELVAVMGPSGCGKTTFLDVLMGRRDEGTIEGEILINGIPKHARKNLADSTGYVLQLATPYYQDLTVSENLLYSSILRLPKHMSWHNRIERVLQVMGETGLLQMANTTVGGLQGAGLSGGQKRRLCVALQLLRLPRILFLDEPTSGLDASSSLELLQTLHCLALSGRTVVLTIHQPRLEIYHMFHKILFLCRGQVAYFGSPFKAPAFFSEAVEECSIKVPVEKMNNPADTIMDILANETAQEEILRYYKLTGDADAVCKAVDSSRRTTDEGQSKSSESKPGLFLRLFALESRTSARQTTVKIFYLPILFLLLGLIMGSTYWQSHSSLMVMSVYCIISCSSAIFLSSIVMGLLLQPLQVFSVEHQDGVSKAIDIVLHVFIRVSAVSIFPVTLSLFITYLFVTTSYVWTDFLFVLLIQLLVSHTWVAVFILTVCCKPSMSHRICPLIAALAGFTSGFIVARPNMPIYYRWLFPINPTYWGYAATVKILLENIKFDCEYDSQLECYPFSGLYTLELFGLHNTNPYLSLVTLLGILIACLSLATFILELTHTPHVMRTLFQTLFRLTQARSQVRSWPSGLPGSINTHTTDPSQKSSDEGYNSVSWVQPTSQSLSRKRSTMSALLDDELEEHEVKDNQSITDRLMDKSPEVQPGIPSLIHQPSPEMGLIPRRPTDIFSDDGSSPMDIRATRTVYILAERHKKMQANLSSSLATLFCARRWRTNSMHKQRARKNILTRVSTTNLPLKKRQASTGGIQNGSISDYQSIHGKRHFSIYFNSVNSMPTTAFTSGKIPDGSSHNWSSRNCDKLPTKENGQSAISRFAGNCTENSSCPLPVHFPPLRLKRRHSSLPDALHRLDELFGLEGDEGCGHNMDTKLLQPSHNPVWYQGRDE